LRSDTIDRFGPPLAVAVAVTVSLATLTIAGVEPLANLADEPFEIAILSAVPVLATFVGCLIWGARSRTTEAVAVRARDADPYANANPDSVTLSNLDNKRCPDCAELVKDGAAICRFCGHRFWGTTSGAERTSRRLGLGLLVAVVGAAGVVYVLRSTALSDAESSWCRANVPAVAAMADSLSLDPPADFPAWAEWGEVVSSGLLGELWNSDSFTPISDRPNRDRACRAAFEVR